MKLHLAHDDHWEQVNNTFVHGGAFIDDTYLSPTELATRISRIDTRAELKQILQSLNGFFSVIHTVGETGYLTVDHVRSWPLYYAATDDVYVSDSPEWVHRAGARRGYDPIAAVECLFTSFVSGDETMSRDVKQVQAGELVTVDTSSNPEAQQERYFTYCPEEYPERRRRDGLDRVFTDAVSRLVDYADGRTILLGLSSGYDSRLIALLLSRLGYDNVVTYTTDTASASPDDIPVARSLASDLGFEHIEIRYDHSDFDSFHDSDQLREFIRDTGYLAEYPQIHKLTKHQKFVEAGIHPEKVVHVLGHIAVGGEAVPRWVGTQDTLDSTEYFDLLWGLHYSNWKEASGSRWRRLFEGKMIDRPPVDIYRTGTVETVPEAMKGYEQWHWQERLPKYLIARREYASLGYDTWYPLLDRELYSFLEQTSHRERIDKRLLKEYVRDLDAKRRDTASRAGGSRLQSGVSADSRRTEGVADESSPVGEVTDGSGIDRESLDEPDDSGGESFTKKGSGGVSIAGEGDRRGDSAEGVADQTTPGGDGTTLSGDGTSGSDSSIDAVRETAWKNAIQLVKRLPDPLEETIDRQYKQYRTTNMYETDARYGIVSEAEFTSFRFRKVHYRPLLLLLLSADDEFEFPTHAEFDWAVNSP